MTPAVMENAEDTLVSLRVAHNVKLRRQPPQRNFATWRLSTTLILTRILVLCS